ncbi:hypothetical protein ACFLZA_02600 [Candidatus Neomarinimicrobiota bacterium]
MSGGTEAIWNYGPAISFSGINSGRRRAAIASVQTSEDHDQIGLAFFTYPSTNTAYDDISQMMVITHNGDVGVGTATPSSKLDVNGSVILGESGTSSWKLKR